MARAGEKCEVARDLKLGVRMKRQRSRSPRNLRCVGVRSRMRPGFGLGQFRHKWGGLMSRPYPMREPAIGFAFAIDPQPAAAFTLHLEVIAERPAHRQAVLTLPPRQRETLGADGSGDAVIDIA